MSKSIAERLKNHDRYSFPIKVVPVNFGKGSEALLLFGSEKTGLFDCGMAFCGEKTVEKLKEALEGQTNKKGEPYTLDYVFASHTHYDHIGALPYIIDAFPDVKVCGSEKGQYVFTRPGALKVIKNLGEAARDQYDPGNTKEIPTDNLRIDIAMKDGDEVSLGEEKVTCFLTKGHTDCSMTYVVEPLGLMFSSESTGFLENNTINTPILKSYEDSIESVQKCREYGAKYLSLPHFGTVPQNFTEDYWDLYEQCAKEKRELVKGWYDEGLSDEEVLEKYTDKYFDSAKAKEQPREAFIINAKNIVKVLGQ